MLILYESNFVNKSLDIKSSEAVFFPDDVYDTLNNIINNSYSSTSSSGNEFVESIVDKLIEKGSESDEVESLTDIYKIT